ncbi:HAD-IA family hydrolase [Agromyces endophyticus]|uniref:HAD-IA family hydrolase n=1 Tax=Agromyces sp. H17E-10 TaxID=2932244 RepID=UPI001FD0E077|nr:HAD-IA family hydrolase [Agromyces sp. H17E-10]UOQ87671.1 HAD-IA family hydrolase [Agromyces sp. H17E-10]
MTTTIHAAAVLLDMDGTLVDSSAVVERVWSDWAVEHALDPAAVMQVIHGRQGHASMAILLPDRPADQNLAENETMLARETSETDGVVAITGAGTLLHALADAPHALVTSATLALATARMSAAGLTVPAVAITAEDVTASKPDPEGFLAAAEVLGVAAADCVVFEDSEAGITAGHRAGMRVVGVGPLAALHDADHVVADLSAVLITTSADGATITLP